MTPPPWPARRVGRMIVCGRQVSGRYVCQGIIGRIEADPLKRFPSGMMTTLPPGMKRIDQRSTHWVPNARAERALAHRPRLDPQATRSARLGGQWAPEFRFPWTRDCPECKVLAIVDSDVLIFEAS